MRGCQCGDFGGQLLSWECNKRRKRGETTILYPFLLFFFWYFIIGIFCMATFVSGLFFIGALFPKKGREVKQLVSRFIFFQYLYWDLSNRTVFNGTFFDVLGM